MRQDLKNSAPIIKPPPLLIESVVFFSGAIVMTLELVGSRLLAPYFGNSLFVWTSLIGVVLGFIAIGNYLGGRLGDRYISTTLLFWILALASLSVSIIAFAEGFFIPRLAESSAVRSAAVGSAVILFSVPALVLGMVSPYCIRLKMHSVSDSGATVGSLYAISTLGSIVGTFVAGFWLIAALGSHDIIGWLAAALLALSLLFFFPVSLRRSGMFALALVALIGAIVFSKASIDSFDTQYDRYFMKRETEAATMRPVITLARDFESIESAVYADNGEPFLFNYYPYYDLALAVAPQVEHTLLIGGGMFSYPRHQLESYPQSRTDVVEIDPALVELAKTTFWLDDDPRIRIAVEDGRTYLNNSTAKYDVVLIDAFKSAHSIPYQLTTRESMKRCYDLLTDDGVLVMNVLASTEGPGSRFLWAEYSTLKSIFPQVEMFVVFDASKTELVQNISIIASKSKSIDLAARVAAVNPELAATKVRELRIPEETRILTDDFAPVDQYLMDL